MKPQSSSAKGAKSRPSNKHLRSRLDRVRVGIGDFSPSLTKQAFKAEADVNTIMSKYVQTGILPYTDNRVAQFGDFSDGIEYDECLNRIYQAEDQFAELPSNIRAQFDNDPAKFITFINNSTEEELAAELGKAYSAANSDGVNEEASEPAPALAGAGSEADE